MPYLPSYDSIFGPRDSRAAEGTIEECNRTLRARPTQSSRAAKLCVLPPLACNRTKGHEGKCCAFGRHDELDTSVLLCPCGAAFEWGDLGGATLAEWKATHRPHLEVTDGR
jgi:hypothetical protein